MTAIDPPRPIVPPGDVNADLGFGSVVTQESRQRLLNRNGSFNVRREGMPFWQSLSIYHYLLTIGWPTFLGYVAGVYLLTNAVFAVGYVLCGPEALTGFHGRPLEHDFGVAFFFSVHTLATIGYGSISPMSFPANVLVTVESLIGLLGFSIVAGIVFARFARPVAQILFSRNALIAPYRDGKAFMFRIVNQRNSQLVQLEAKVMVARRKKDGAAVDREFIQLKLERERVVFFPLSWTIVHPIDRDSPLWDVGAEDLERAEAEFLVLLNGFDETFSQTVHTRSSYLADEVVWGGKFKSMFNPPQDDGVVSVDIGRLDDFERVAL